MIYNQINFKSIQIIQSIFDEEIKNTEEAKKVKKLEEELSKAIAEYDVKRKEIYKKVLLKQSPLINFPDVLILNKNNHLLDFVYSAVKYPEHTSDLLDFIVESQKTPSAMSIINGDVKELKNQRIEIQLLIAKKCLDELFQLIPSTQLVDLSLSYSRIINKSEYYEFFENFIQFLINNFDDSILKISISLIREHSVFIFEEIRYNNFELFQLLWKKVS